MNLSKNDAAIESLDSEDMRIIRFIREKRRKLKS